MLWDETGSPNQLVACDNADQPLQANIDTNTAVINTETAMSGD